MTPRGLVRLLLGYALLLFLACLAMRSHASLRELAPSEQQSVESQWREGKRVARRTREPGTRASLAASAGGADAASLVEEVVVAEGPLSLGRLTFPYALVPGRDGVMAELDGKLAWATVDDLLSVQAYDTAQSFLDPSMKIGTHHAVVVHLLATQLGAPPAEVEARARVRRVRFERHVMGAPPPAPVAAAALDREAVTGAVRDGAAYLARGVDAEGRYRYLVDAVTNRPLAGYNWPRHAGTTYFLAQAAALLDDAPIRAACLRAAARLRDEMMKSCGDNRCIAADSEADVGSSALALLAFAEIVRTGADASYTPAIAALARFLRAQQRPDGDLMHLYDRNARRPVDVQFLYFTGEASLALARAHRITGDAEDLRAASRALAHISGPGWSFFGSRYYFSEEHWTCQAVGELWDRAPDPTALAFCLRWHEYQRRLQHEDGDSPFEGADGSFGFGAIITPRVTPASSRGEAAGAVLEVLRRDPGGASASVGPRAGEGAAALLDDELRRAVAFVMRSQLRPGPEHLFAAPSEVRGGVPGSAVELQLRTDFVQHAGSMMIRWLEVTALTPR